MRDRKYIDYTPRRPAVRETLTSHATSQGVTEQKPTFVEYSPKVHIAQPDGSIGHDSAVKDTIDDARNEDVIAKHYAPKKVVPLKHKNLRYALVFLFVSGLIGMGIVSGIKAYKDEGKNSTIIPANAPKVFDPENPSDIADDILKYVSEPSDGADFDTTSLNGSLTGIQP